MRFKLIIEYKGLSFIGWQKQANNSNSICATIEKAIFNLTGQMVDLVGSGRTDAGVNALGQVAHFDLSDEKLVFYNTDHKMAAFKIQGGLNHFLRTTEIAILNCQLVSNDFHSRFDAKMRHYQYLIINRHCHLTLFKNLAWHVKNKLDIDLMRDACQFLIGKHDFSSFRDSECQAKSAIRTINKITIEKNEDEIKINFSAPSFLHHQIRNIVGTLVLVGRGKISVNEVDKILKARDRQKSGSNAPSGGLYFVRVDY